MRVKLVNSGLERPANTTTYSDGDVISAAGAAGTMLKFSGLAMFSDRVNPCGGLITQAVLVKDSASDALEADLYLFSEEFAIAADNAAFAPTFEQMQSLVGVIPFPEADEVAGTNAAFNVQMGLRVAATDTLYGVLVARNAYVPTSGEEIQVSLGVIRNLNT